MAVSGLQLRLGTIADASTISALAVQVFLDTYATEGIRPDLAAEAFDEYGRSRFEERLAEKSRTFVLSERASGLVGFAEVLLQRLPAPNTKLEGAELVRLYVQPKAQRLGVGRALLHRVEKISTEANLSTVWLTAWEHNARALAFYAAQGYELVGTTAYTFQGNSYGNKVLAKHAQTTASGA